MNPSTPHLADAALHEDLERVLESTRPDPAIVVRCVERIRGLNPVSDAGHIATTRSFLAEHIRALRDQDDTSEALRAARLLLNHVAARETTLGAPLQRLLDEYAARFTPSLVRALWLARDRPRSRAELALEVSSETCAFMTDDLVRLGMLARIDAAEDASWFRLTPAGRDAMTCVAQTVLAAELGRFPWPEDVLRPERWAQDKHFKFFPFEHEGRDGRELERCLETQPGVVGSLSTPNLKGVARPLPSAHTPKFSSVALLRDAKRWDENDTVTHVGRVLDDHRRLLARSRDVARGPASEWKLTLFASPDLPPDVKQTVTRLCEEERVPHAFADAA